MTTPRPTQPTSRTESIFVRKDCIDPRFVAEPLYTPLGPNVFFPHVAGATLQMRRISVRSFPSLAAAKMTSLQAESIFVSPDDLTSDLPTDNTLPATQTFALDASKSPVLRQSEGRLSWMATRLVPRIDGPRVIRDAYTLSVVVFSNRDSSMQISSGAVGVADNERVVDVSQFLGGGDLELADAERAAGP